ncbi:hypothetical protein BaRGS_00039813 [Batillaria attramentaria]|uniref:Uncharacterized protein n=1 Tax=Batillaria attramentaria TaxID=370345 RepID=A0ABD0J276_9CAEN
MITGDRTSCFPDCLPGHWTRRVELVRYNHNTTCTTSGPDNTVKPAGSLSLTCRFTGTVAFSYQQEGRGVECITDRGTSYQRLL